MYRSLPLCNHVDHASCVVLMNETASHGGFAKKYLFVQCPAIGVRNHKFDLPATLQVLPYCRPLKFALPEEVHRVLVHISKKVRINPLEWDTLRKRIWRD